MNDELKNDRGYIFAKDLIAICIRRLKGTELTFNEAINALVSTTVNLTHGCCKEECVGTVLDEIISQLLDHRDTLLKDEEPK